MQLRLKLLKRGLGETGIGAALDRLESLGLIDDERFARAWLSARVGGLREGREKLFAGLMARGASRETAVRAIRDLLDEGIEQAAVRTLAEKWGGGKQCTGREGPDAKTLRKLRARGFSGKTIRNAFSADDD